ncbi:MAG: FAD:protein FMN transferase [Bacteroidales bacterium]|nr:FAD:protein FMN transferase [Bacteroidales bacterium]
MKKTCFLILPLLFLLLSCQKGEKRYVYDGMVQGTYYHIIIYAEDTAGIQHSFDSIFQCIDNTLSLWNANSLLTKVNNNENPELNDIFTDNFELSVLMNKLTDSAFDVTIGGVVQAYGFANKSKQQISSSLLDSLLLYVGMDKVRIENHRLIKQYPQTQLDFNAIAQGYTTDLISKYLIGRAVSRFLVDVGGELYCKGEKPGGEKWIVGIETPTDNPDAERSYDVKVGLKDESIVTSGNYRKFYIENGVKYSHTIDPKTARSVRHSLLSASVIAEDASTADALATAFMVMGLEKAKVFLDKHKEYSAYLIYSDEKGGMKVWYSPSFEKYFIKDNE